MALVVALTNFQPQTISSFPPKIEKYHANSFRDENVFVNNAHILARLEELVQKPVDLMVLRCSWQCPVTNQRCFLHCLYLWNKRQPSEVGI